MPTIAEDRTFIRLMHRAGELDCSLITIKVREGVRQAFRTCSEVHSDVELMWIAEWYEGGVGYRPHRGRMRALCA